MSYVGQRPKYKFDANLDELKQFASYQMRLFTVAVALLKPGGSLVYSTCSMNPLENEEIVCWALHTFPDLALMDARDGLDAYDLFPLGEKGLLCRGHHLGERNVLRDDGSPLSPESIASRVLSFDPSLDDTIGFFIAKFTKRHRHHSP